MRLNDKVEAGQPLFRLDSSEQEAALETDAPAHRGNRRRDDGGADGTGGGRRS